MKLRNGQRFFDLLVILALISLVIAALWWVGSHRSITTGERIYPDSTLTPGATNPDVTQDTLNITICSRKWSTRSIRPPAAYTGTLKRKQILEYGYSDMDPSHYEEDHLIPLWLGGHPTDPKNLWPESYNTTPGAKDKDIVENYLHFEVCKRKMTLRDAQRAIVTDWVAVLKKLKQEGYVDPWQK